MRKDLIDFYKGRRVFVTGDTGFKGSWLCRWLRHLGAEVSAVALPAEEKSHYSVLDLNWTSAVQDIRDESAMTQVMSKFRPEIVFHLAAQPLVKESYVDPVTTYETNVLGSLKVYRAAQKAGVDTLVSVTTDKVYENLEQDRAFHESDRLGGHDPYSASKACVEIMSSSFFHSFLADPSSMKLATARAGNVIGGGDWAKDRILPDLMRSAASGTAARIRRPEAVRPWQHVLEPLAGYLLLGKAVFEGKFPSGGTLNFGPDPSERIPVGEVCAAVGKEWPAARVQMDPASADFAEMTLLRLSIEEAGRRLGWKPRLPFAETIAWTVSWYRAYHEAKRVLTDEQIELYMERL